MSAESARGFGLSKEFQTGVLFSTYTMLTSNFKSSSSRMQQIINWCGGESFTGCLIFDECHKAKNCDTSGKKETSKVSQAVCLLQSCMPKARVVYCSATGVSGLENMAYMNRLGLWGTSTPFKDFHDFHQSIKRRGLGALELLAIELKQSGKYVSGEKLLVCHELYRMLL